MYKYINLPTCHPPIHKFTSIQIDKNVNLSTCHILIKFDIGFKGITVINIFGLHFSYINIIGSNILVIIIIFFIWHFVKLNYSLIYYIYSKKD